MGKKNLGWGVSKEKWHFCSLRWAEQLHMTRGKLIQSCKSKHCENRYIISIYIQYQQQSMAESEDVTDYIVVKVELQENPS